MSYRMATAGTVLRQAAFGTGAGRLQELVRGYRQGAFVKEVPSQPDKRACDAALERGGVWGPWAAAEAVAPLNKSR